MDIASRIKFFMNSMSVGSSQFADTCQIPRPTLSQILNGRNKKISDEIIGKIHDAYPHLSVLWLMFGEGDMVTDVNTQISEPQTGSVIDFEMEQPSINEHFIDKSTLPPNSSEKSAEKILETQLPLHEVVGASVASKMISTKAPSASAATSTPHEEAESSSVSLSNLNNGKRIVNIMVFYDDNSFESFTPAATK